MKGNGNAGLLGLKGSSSSTGPNEGQGMGQRDPGTPEGTKFETKRLRPQELGQGDIVGTLPSDEETLKGDVQVPVEAPSRADIERMAEKVDTEVLPAEYREQIRQYMESLLRSQPGSGTGGEPPGSGSKTESPPEGKTSPKAEVK